MTQTERDFEDQLIANAEAFLDAMASPVGPAKRPLDFKQRGRARKIRTGISQDHLP